MNPENILEKLKHIFSGKVNLNILDNQVDVKTQMEYFEMAVDIRRKINSDEILCKSENLFNQYSTLQEKKELLIGLSSIDKVEAYRTIERFVECADANLKDWSLLALQESKMLIESTLLGESQVFISTGLGGKDNKLRYFTSIFSNSEKFTEVQRKIVKKEFHFFIKKINGEIEELKFRNNIGLAVFCIPLTSKPAEFLKMVIEECNVLGNFLSKKFIITNVKIFSFSELDKLKREKIDKDFNE